MLNINGDSIQSPVGRLLSNNIFQPRVKDHAGKDMLHPQFSAWVAIRKDDPHWQQFWQHIAAIAARDWPAGQFNTPTFSWKVKDGDTAVDSKGQPYPEHCKGCYLVSFSSTIAPEAFNENNEQVTAQHNLFYNGCYVEVFGSIKGNGSAVKPGVYVNLNMIKFRGHGEKIVGGPDAATAFGNNATPLPQGASATPVGGGTMPAMAAPIAQPVPAGMPVAQPAPAGMPVAQPAPAAMPVAQPAPAGNGLPGASAPATAVDPNASTATTGFPGNVAPNTNFPNV